MCEIIGIYSNKGISVEVSTTAIDSFQHRIPDSESYLSRRKILNV